MADGEDANGSTEALEFHLRSCAACRAKLRAYRAIPGTVFELMPAGPLLDQSMGGRPARMGRRDAPARSSTRSARPATRCCRAAWRERWQWVTPPRLQLPGGSRGRRHGRRAQACSRSAGRPRPEARPACATGVVDPGSDRRRLWGQHKRPLVRAGARRLLRRRGPQPGDPVRQPVIRWTSRHQTDSAGPPPQPTPVQQKTRQFGVDVLRDELREFARRGGQRPSRLRAIWRRRRPRRI